MKLGDYLEKTGTRRSFFARMIGVSPASVTEYCDGAYPPRFPVIERIVRATQGAVTANDFLSPDVARLIAK